MQHIKKIIFICHSIDVCILPERCICNSLTAHRILCIVWSQARLEPFVWRDCVRNMYDPLPTVMVNHNWFRITKETHSVCVCLWGCIQKELPEMGRRNMGGSVQWAWVPEWIKRTKGTSLLHSSSSAPRLCTQFERTASCSCCQFLPPGQTVWFLHYKLK